MGRHRFRWSCNPWPGGFLYTIGQLYRYTAVEDTDSELGIVLYWRGEEGTGWNFLDTECLNISKCNYNESSVYNTECKMIDTGENDYWRIRFPSALDILFCSSLPSSYITNYIVMRHGTGRRCLNMEQR